MISGKAGRIANPIRRLGVWEARNVNGWTTIVMEQPDGTFIGWAGPDDTIGVDYVEDTPGTRRRRRGCLEAQERALHVLIRCSAFEIRLHTMLVAPPGARDDS
jgi:hypothetical protein